MVGGQCRDRRGAAVGQLVAVEHRAQLPGTAVEQQVRGVDGGHGRAGVGREVGDGLHADQLAVHPGRHQQQRPGASVGQAHRMHMAFGGGNGALGQRRGDGGDQLGPRRGGPNRDGVEGADQWAPFVGLATESGARQSEEDDNGPAQTDHVRDPSSGRHARRSSTGEQL